MVPVGMILPVSITCTSHSCMRHMGQGKDSHVRSKTAGCGPAESARDRTDRAGQGSQSGEGQPEQGRTTMAERGS